MGAIYEAGEPSAADGLATDHEERLAAAVRSARAEAQRLAAEYAADQIELARTELRRELTAQIRAQVVRELSGAESGAESSRPHPAKDRTARRERRSRDDPASVAAALDQAHARIAELEAALADAQADLQSYRAALLAYQSGAVDTE